MSHAGAPINQILIVTESCLGGLISEDIQVYQTPFNVQPDQRQDWCNCKFPLQQLLTIKATDPASLAQSHLFLETYAMELLPQVTTIKQPLRKFRPLHSRL